MRFSLIPLKGKHVIKHRGSAAVVLLPALAPELSGTLLRIHTESKDSLCSKSNRSGIGLDELILVSRFIHFTALGPLFGGSLFRFCVEPQLRASARAPFGNAHW
jgi:hypothetical protein